MHLFAKVGGCTLKISSVGQDQRGDRNESSPQRVGLFMLNVAERDRPVILLLRPEKLHLPGSNPEDFAHQIMGELVKDGSRGGQQIRGKFP